jgi:hypothetical protein
LETQPLKATSRKQAVLKDAETQAVKICTFGKLLFFTLSIPCLPFLSLFADHLCIPGLSSIGVVRIVRDAVQDVFPGCVSSPPLHQTAKGLVASRLSHHGDISKPEKTSFEHARDANAIRMVINYPQTHTHIRMYYS